MASRLHELFSDEKLVKRIKDRLPNLFYQAEVESSRAGKVGMEVGSLRETILIALLMYKFGEANVNTNIPIIEHEVDVTIFNEPISIKTKTGTGFKGVKLSWTVDAIKAHEFIENYCAECDMLLAILNWGKAGGLFYIPMEAQKTVLETIGPAEFFVLPKPGTNPRGVEISGKALEMTVRDQRSMSIPILWRKPDVTFDKYERWLTYWRKD
jgi:hypothetical protein